MESSHSSPKKNYEERLAGKPVERLMLMPVGGIDAACNCDATALQRLVCLAAQQVCSKVEARFFFFNLHQSAY